MAKWKGRLRLNVSHEMTCGIMEASIPIEIRDNEISGYAGDDPNGNTIYISKGGGGVLDLGELVDMKKEKEGKCKQNTM